MALARLATARSLHGSSFHRLRSGLPLRCRGQIRNLSANMSPPSMAVVYEHHGLPESVTRSEPFHLPVYWQLWWKNKKSENWVFEFLFGRVIELPPVEVKENDVCVKMLAAPINPSDINRIEGWNNFLSFSVWLPRELRRGKEKESPCRLTWEPEINSLVVVLVWVECAFFFFKFVP